MGAQAFTLYDVLTRGAALHGDAPALIQAARQWSFRQLVERADRLAAGLVALGLSPGDRICILAQNDAQYVDLAELSRRQGSELPAERFGGRVAWLGPGLGAQRLGFNVTVIAPGKCAFPFHSHRANEELFYVIEGTGELRFGAATHPLRAGDVVACPPGGAEVAHQIVNTGAAEMKVLAVSTMLRSPTRYGSAASARSSRSPRSTTVGTSAALSTSTANSSLPHRATVSSAITPARSRRAAWASTWSPPACPIESFTAVNPSRSAKITATGPRRATTSRARSSK